MKQGIRGGAARLGRRLFRLGAVALAAVAVVVIAAALWTQYRFQEPFMRTWSRALKPELAWQRAKYPSIDWAFAIPAALMVNDNRHSFQMISDASAEGLALSERVGPRVLAEPLPARYSAEGVPLPVMGLAEDGERSAPAAESLPSASPTMVSNTIELAKAVRKAQPGDHILLLPGTYVVGRTLEAMTSGTPEQPIFVRAARLGDATVQVRTTQGFAVYGAYWVFENLSFEGTCPIDEYCEHALHIVQNAKGIIIRNNVLRNFNAPIKVNLGRKREQAPDYGLIEGNRFSNDRPRNTTRPVTLVDIVGADGWRVASNILADFAKVGADNTSYAAFFKGANRGGVFERNLVMCEWKHRGGIRLGLSLGGGGTAHYACRDRSCAFENEGGVIRNNVILNCPNDVGIYLNKASNAVIHNNLIADTMGIDVRYKQSDALIFNNIIDGRVRERDGGIATLEANATPGWTAALLNEVSDGLFQNPAKGDFTPKDVDAIAGRGKPLPAGRVDFCGRLHDGAKPDIGPFSLAGGKTCAEPWVGR